MKNRKQQLASEYSLYATNQATKVRQENKKGLYYSTMMHKDEVDSDASSVRSQSIQNKKMISNDRLGTLARNRQSVEKVSRDLSDSRMKLKAMQIDMREKGKDEYFGKVNR